MRAANPKMFRELLVGLGAMVCVIATLGVVVWINIGRLEAADAAAREAHAELSLYDALMESAVSQETGLRGYLLTDDPEFLTPYWNGRRRFQAAMRLMPTFEADDSPEVRRRLDDVGARMAEWDRAVAQPQLAEHAGRTPHAAAQAVGRAHIDQVRQDIAEARRTETAVIAERDRRHVAALRASQMTLALGSAVLVLFAIGISARFSWRLLRTRRAAKRQAEALRTALRRAAAAEVAKSVFLSNMSHEMRTPLNGVVGMAQVLEGTRLDARQREIVRTIRTSAGDLDGLIGNLLTLSYADPAAAPKIGGVFDLARQMRAVAANYAAAAEAKGLRLALSMAPEAEIRVRCDAAKLERILSCLLSNAVKFTDHGEVRLTALRLAGKAFRIEVSDTGVGFDERLKSRLFETFVQSDESATRRFGGAGLGLAVARRLAADLGGRLDCRSAPGVGSTFVLDLDLSPAEDEPWVERLEEVAAA